MLKTVYLLAKIGTDTAENERNFAEISNIAKKAGNYRMGPICPVVLPAQLQAGWAVEFGTVQFARSWAAPRSGGLSATYCAR